MRRSVVGREQHPASGTRGSVGLRVASSAVVLTGVLVVLVWVPPLVATVAAVVAAATCSELTALLSQGRTPASPLAAAVTGLVVLVAAAGAACLVAALLAGVAVVALTAGGRAPARALAALSVGWAGLPMGLAVLLADTSSGRRLLVLVVVLIGVFESVALLSGRRWGRLPITPRISPGKTVEGTAAAVVATLAVGCSLWAAGTEDAATALATAVTVCAFGFVGDLAGSLAKRAALVKDSGSLVPGHGGMLDYVDGFLFVVPMVFALQLLQPALGAAP
jgi:phosphatidate cytidylyltransferase